MHGGLKVSELAKRSGVAPSTVRFYERAGLISPARRQDNGYRVFDEAALDELAFVHRAKAIGMSLGEVAELVAARRVGPCRWLQGRLQDFLVGRIDQVRRQRADLGAFEGQLETVLGRLAARDEPGEERCGQGCGCGTDLDLRPDDESRSWGCSLDHGDLRARIDEWRAIAGTAISSERTHTRVRLTFAPTADVTASLAALCAAEVACCAQTRFGLDVTATAVTLTVDAPDTPHLLDTLFLRPSALGAQRSGAR